MRNQILAANWKMYLTQPQVDEWLSNFQSHDLPNTNSQLRIYPSALFIKDVLKIGLHVGAQNIASQTEGAFTGELSIGQLKSVGAKSVLLGHSERRQLCKESDDDIIQKIVACVNEDFPFIFCCGETLSCRKQNAQNDFILGQLTSNLNGLSSKDLHLLVVAYEPIWAIGTEESASIEQIGQMHNIIRSYLIDRFGSVANQVPILYGGSVNQSNAKDIFRCENVDGALVGGASLDPVIFYELWKALNT